MSHSTIVLDTNVLISAILFGGKPRIVLEKVRTGGIHCPLSPPILEELQHVLRRPKFGFSADAAFQVVEELQAICSVVFPRTSLSVVTADSDDDRVLECALEAWVDVIVSGDSHLLSLGEFRNIRIMSPADYLAELDEI